MRNIVSLFFTKSHSLIIRIGLWWLLKKTVESSWHSKSKTSFYSKERKKWQSLKSTKLSTKSIKSGQANSLFTVRFGTVRFHGRFGSWRNGGSSHRCRQQWTAKKKHRKNWLTSSNLKNKFSRDFSYFHFENFPYQGSVNFF